jgi:Tol biopolymer transport system component
MYLRDAVVNDRIPPMTRWNGGGFFAYRMGHAVFDFIVERWGWEGYIDFIYEYRNTIGGNIGRAVERTFRMEPEEFDDEFRLWLRKKYLAELLETGEPGEFGRPFRGPQGQNSQDVSPSSSPSGDLVAAFNASTGDVDVVLYDTENRRFLRNLTKGFTNDYQYLVAQELSLGRTMGRDLSFSPDGNTIVAFGRREGGRSLLFLDVLKGGIRKRIDMPDIDQQLSPAWSPDGRTIAFAGWQDGQFDIFLLDVDSEQITNLTHDAIYDGAPTFSRDGKSVVFSSVVGEGHAKLFRIDLDRPDARVQLTHGESDDVDAIYSTVANRIYFTSDRTGVNNIFSLDLESGQLKQYTNSVTGSFTPTVLPEPDGNERLIFVSMWKGRFQMYVTDTEEEVGEPQTVEVSTEPTQVEDIPAFEPDIQVAVNDEDKEKYGGFKLFLENADTVIGLNDDQTFIGQVILTWSDFLGDKRLFASFASIDSFSNFSAAYFDLSRRRQWSLRIFDSRTFSLTRDLRDFDIERAQLEFRQTGVIASLIYPLSFYTRAEIGAGYISRKLQRQLIIEDENGNIQPVVFPTDDDFPILEGALAGDSAIFASWGAISGRRWRLDAFYAPEIGGNSSQNPFGNDGSTVTASLDIDFRQYIPLSRRSNLAWRVFAGASDGNNPSPFIIGGLDTVRGVDFNSLAGDRAFFTNVELRFPLIDVLATPVIGFQGIRGVVFLDIGGAWFSELEDFEFWDSTNDRLGDAVADYGWGLSVRLFGLDFNWDFAREWDFDQAGDFKTTFWIGARF